MKLRLYHHRDGARVAYREQGVGPSLCLVHSAALSHREFVPIAEHLSDRFRLVLPDLPLHGDSEDRPRYPYTLTWLAEVMAEFCRETCGTDPIVGGHGAGAEILLRACVTGQLAPAKIVLMPNRLHCAPQRSRLPVPLQRLAPIAALPGLDRVASRGVRFAYRPEHGMKLSARGNPAARDLVRHATADVAGNANLVRSWSRWLRRWPAGAQTELLEAYPRLRSQVLLLWADRDRHHPLAGAEQALELLPDAQLRVLSGTGFLMAYDDPVGVARELTAFCLQPAC
jgi:pimeloyl-ACP methyl ester carboxylesterase